MLFFQIFLAAGYGYAHAATRWLAPRRQAVMHALLVLAALCCLPITPDAVWKPAPDDDPVLRILRPPAACWSLACFALHLQLCGSVMPHPSLVKPTFPKFPILPLAVILHI
jgi:hypothetical protein